MCIRQLNMPQKISIEIRTKLCNGGKCFSDLVGPKFLCSVAQLKEPRIPNWEYSLQLDYTLLLHSSTNMSMS